MFGDVNLWAIFVTGLLTGGISCIAVQGALLATMLAGRSSSAKASTFAKAMADRSADKSSDKELSLQGLTRNGYILPVVSFLLAKLIAYTILGALPGWLGEVLHLSIQLQVVFLVLVAIFMLGTALNMLQIHPLFRYFVLQPPRFLTRIVRRYSKQKFGSRVEKDIFGPALLGAFTIFIPCGVTQAMMVLAIGTASPWLGAAVLFAFVLGTWPVFFVIGYLTTKLGETLQGVFTKLASAVIILLAIFTLNSAVALTGSFWTLQNIFYNAFCVVSFCSDRGLVL